MPDCETFMLNSVFPHAVKYACGYGHDNFTNYFRSWIQGAMHIYCDQKLSVVKAIHFGILQLSESISQRKMMIKDEHKNILQTQLSACFNSKEKGRNIQDLRLIN